MESLLRSHASGIIHCPSFSSARIKCIKGYCLLRECGPQAQEGT